MEREEDAVLDRLLWSELCCCTFRFFVVIVAVSFV